MSFNVHPDIEALFEQEAAANVEDRTYVPVATNINQARNTYNAYLNTYNVDEEHAGDQQFPQQTAQQQAALARRLHDSIIDSDEVDKSKVHAPAVAISLIAWKLVEALEDAQRGICRVDPHFTKGGAKYEAFESIEDRADTVCEALESDASLCVNMFQGDIWIRRLCWNPARELKLKKSNAKGNAIKNQTVKVAADAMRRELFIVADDGSITRRDGTHVANSVADNLPPRMLQAAAKDRTRTRVGDRADIKKMSGFHKSSTARRGSFMAHRQAEPSSTNWNEPLMTGALNDPVNNSYASQDFWGIRGHSDFLSPVNSTVPPTQPVFPSQVGIVTGEVSHQSQQATGSLVQPQSTYDSFALHRHSRPMQLLTNEHRGGQQFDIDLQNILADFNGGGGASDFTSQLPENLHDELQFGQDIMQQIGMPVDPELQDLGLASGGYGSAEEAPSGQRVEVPTGSFDDQMASFAFDDQVFDISQASRYNGSSFEQVQGLHSGAQPEQQGQEETSLDSFFEFEDAGS
ncbi:hypothetical protein JX265_011225 [Neoarthrinium moseri]|uniref:Uncharacterized protein n=1 Tax=Neoarthrinium moseri TaxID=1658444 RepID=A0A9P9WCN2_9PEZI|nr:hypothetical protein JX265_011225 [Neoarthrinium moseri]